LVNPVAGSPSEEEIEVLHDLAKFQEERPGSGKKWWIPDVHRKSM
jgi:hypothetical protein